MQENNISKQRTFEPSKKHFLSVSKKHHLRDKIWVQLAETMLSGKFYNQNGIPGSGTYKTRDPIKPGPTSTFLGPQLIKPGHTLTKPGPYMTKPGPTWKTRTQ